ncbi:MAG TPA: GlsB/YeaQ/YmgE family stress response membrane protein [Actinomycetospora sp.]|nr:GlsB/YeaQ/YmgE family stress response membrane protein [Actinomycetospora sp.]
MGILGWIVLGLVVGALAKLAMPGDDPGGVVVTGLLGIVGALLGGFIGQALFGTGLGDFFDLRTWVLAFIGSVILLGIYRVVTRRRART